MARWDVQISRTVVIGHRTTVEADSQKEAADIALAAVADLEDAELSQADDVSVEETAVVFSVPLPASQEREPPRTIQ